MKKIALLLCVVLVALMFLPGCSGKKAAAYTILDQTLADEEYGIGFRKDDLALRDEVQMALLDLKKDGTAAEITTKWFGSDISTIPDSFIVTDSTDGSFDKVKAAGKLRLGLDDSFPPMGFNQGGEIVGYDIDLAKAVCDKLGIDLELVPIVWANNVQELNGGNIDCIWNGMTINDERAAVMSLSEPYMKNRQVVVTLDNSGITTLDGLKGKTVILQSGSTAADALDSFPDLKASLKGGAAVEVENNVVALFELKQGNGDAIIMDEVVARYYIEHLSQLESDASAS